MPKLTPKHHHSPGPVPGPPPPSASATGEVGGATGAAAANENSGFLVRSPTRPTIGRRPGLGPPNLGDLSQSGGGETTLVSLAGGG